VLVALAAALVQHPKILVLDEYDSHLDETHCHHIDGLIQTCAIPYVLRCTQQMETAAESDHLLYLEDGALLHSGIPRLVFASLDQTPFYPMSWRCRV